jgi:hypothetical protein
MKHIKTFEQYNINEGVLSGIKDAVNKIQSNTELMSAMQKVVDEKKDTPEMQKIVSTLTNVGDPMKTIDKVEKEVATIKNENLEINESVDVVGKLKNILKFASNNLPILSSIGGVLMMAMSIIQNPEFARYIETGPSDWKFYLGMGIVFLSLVYKQLVHPLLFKKEKA